MYLYFIINESSSELEVVSKEYFARVLLLYTELMIVNLKMHLVRFVAKPAPYDSYKDALKFSASIILELIRL